MAKKFAADIRAIAPGDYPLLEDFLYHAGHEDYTMLKDLRETGLTNPPHKYFDINPKAW